MNRLVPSLARGAALRRTLATQRIRLPSQPISIKPSKLEVERAQLSARNLETAIFGLHRDGLVVIEDLIQHDHLDRLNQKMEQDALILQARKQNSPFNYIPGNIQQDPPPLARYFSTSIFMNPIATQVTSTMLGPRPQWTFCSGNTAMPPTPENPPASQPVHSDADFNHPEHPFALVVNVPLITMTPKNGSTEVWLGSHTTSGLHFQDGLHGERASGRIKSTELEKRRAVRPPCQPLVPKGSIVVRDLRLWHAGIGNQTDDIRVMLAMIHFAPWYRTQMKLELADDLKPDIEGHTGLDVPVDWVTASEAMDRYLNRAFGNAYDFSQKP